MDPTNLGKYVLSVEDKRNCGRLLITANIWVLEKSWFMKNLITESGFSGVSKWTYLEAEKTNSKDIPHEFMRYK